MKNSNKLFGERFEPYIIAEIGVNHEGDFELAKKLIEQAKQGGAHAAKFQSYKADLIARKDSPAYWDTTKEPATSQHSLFQRFDGFGEEEYLALAEHCRSVGIDFLSTPFDIGAVDFLEDLVFGFKVASADITNTPLLRKVAKTGKPLWLSTGASTLSEIQSALDTVRLAGAKDVCLLHCVLNYPTRLEDTDLRNIPMLRRVFPDCAIGYSDHTVPTLGMEVLLSATVLGATVIEKHFTHDKTLPGNDHYHAMDQTDLEQFVGSLGVVQLAMGSECRDVSGEAAARKHARRSLVTSRDLKAGEVLTEAALISKRPGDGISPLHIDELLGRRVSRDLSEDKVIAWSDLDESEERIQVLSDKSSGGLGHE